MSLSFSYANMSSGAGSFSQGGMLIDLGANES
jgi:hypothetical protein